MKFPSLRVLPIAVALLLAACSGKNPLEKKVEESNSRLPESAPFGMTLERLSYADSAVNAYFNLEGSEVRVGTVRVHRDRLKEDFAEYMRQQPDTSEIGSTVALIKSEGASLNLYFYSGADTVDITLPADIL